MSDLASKTNDPYAAFRVPSLWRYLLGDLLLQIGLGAQGLAIGWDIYLRTGRPLALGLVGGIQAIPMLLLSLPAGYIADKFDRRKITAICLLGVIVCALGLSWVSAKHGSIELMYLLLLLDATFATLQRPSANSIFPGLVPAGILENAMKWRSSLFQIASVTGPALGAIIVAYSIPAVYIVNAVFALCYVALLLTLRLKLSPSAAGAMNLKQVMAGTRFVWNRKMLLGTISLDLFAVLLGGAVYLLPVYAKDILQVGAHGLGWLRAAPALGAFFMAILLAHLPPMRHAGRAMFLAVAGFGLATIAFGFSRNFLLSWSMLFLTGALDNISVVVRHTLMLMLTPDEMLGRVSAVNFIFIGSSNEIGGLESGLAAQLMSPTLSVVAGGIGTMLVVGIWALAFPRLRTLGALTATAEEDSDAVPAFE